MRLWWPASAAAHKCLPWIVLLPPEVTPAIVRQHVETNRTRRVLLRIEQLVRWALERHELPHILDVELIARAIQDLGEQAGRMVLTDPQSYSPERYERFVETIMSFVWPRENTRSRRRR